MNENRPATAVTPKVSVVMLAYNIDRYVETAIRGVLSQQTDYPVQLVIAEDCSTDNTRTICLRYKERYPDRITLLHEGSTLATLAPHEAPDLYHGTLYEITLQEGSLGSERLLPLLRDWSLSRGCYSFGDRIHLSIALPDIRTETVESYLRGQGVSVEGLHIVPVRPSVEDLFIQLASKGETTDSLNPDTTNASHA